MCSVVYKCCGLKRTVSNVNNYNIFILSNFSFLSLNSLFTKNNPAT